MVSTQSLQLAANPVQQQQVWSVPDHAHVACEREKKHLLSPQTAGS
jgi:hypothetical protein